MNRNPETRKRMEASSNCNITAMAEVGSMNRDVLQNKFIEPGRRSITKGRIRNIKKFNFNLGKVRKNIKAQFYRLQNHSGSRTERLE